MRTTQKITASTISRRNFVGVPLASAALWSAGVHAQAQPQAPALPKTLRLIVAYPTGGVSDVVARALGDKLALQTGMAVVVENKAGASGTIGMDAVAKAPADGSVLGFSAVSPLALNPFLHPSPFDPKKDIAPVIDVMVSPVLILATPACKSRDFDALIKEAKAAPGAIRWATSGQASLGHIMLAQLRAAAKVDITHVPYKGGGQQMNDALGGQFEILSINAGPTLTPHIRTGKLRPLAVGAPERLASLPDVPTLSELGYVSANLSSRFGIFAPAGVPDALLARYNNEFNTALASPEIAAKLKATDNQSVGGSAADFERDIGREREANQRIIRAAGITAE